MGNDVFLKIKKEYDDFYRSLLRKGRLPMWSTQKGFWNASIADEVYEAFSRIGLQKFKNFLDIGSGDGKVVLIASLFCRNAEGVEIDSFLHNKAEEIKNKFGIRNATFHNKDFFEHDFSEHDALFSAPDAPLDKLEGKLLREMKGKLIHYGHHFHPRFLKKEGRFFINGTMMTVYSSQTP